MRHSISGEGGSPNIAIRLPRKTAELLDVLIASFPPHPAGPLTRSHFIRTVIDAGIETLATRWNVQLEPTPKPVKEKSSRKERKLSKRRGA